MSSRRVTAVDVSARGTILRLVRMLLIGVLILFLGVSARALVNLAATCARAAEHGQDVLAVEMSLLTGSLIWILAATWAATRIWDIYRRRGVG